MDAYVENDRYMQYIFKRRVVSDVVHKYRGFVYSRDIVVVSRQQAIDFTRIVYDGNFHTLTPVREDDRFVYMQPSPPLPIDSFVYFQPRDMEETDGVKMFYDGIFSNGAFIRPGVAWVCARSRQGAEARFGMPVYDQNTGFLGLIYDSITEDGIHYVLYGIPVFNKMD